MSRLHGNKKQTSVHWIESLKEIKYEINTKNYKKITEVIRRKHISSSWVSFLKKINFLYKDGFSYWRFKDVNIDNKLIEAFRKERDSYNFQYIKNIKQSKTDLFTNVKTENKQPVKEMINENIEKISIRDAVRIFGKSDSYFRRIQREWKLSKPKAVFMYEGKVHFDLNELNKKFKKVFVEKIKEQPQVKIANNPQVGLIRKFIKWLW
jgi:hypothetical protein